LSTTTTRKPSPRKRASQQFTSSHSFGFPSLCCNRWRKLNYLTEEQKWNYIKEEKKEFGRLRKSSTFVGQSALTNVTEWLSTFFLLYVLLFSTWRHSSIN
jgi:hypothetical protein